jgi:single-stranded-DNA-specific exonuclease
MNESLNRQGPRSFLGVERSAQNRVWRNRLDAAGEARALAIARLSGAGDLLARVLAGRGIPLDGVEAYLDPTLRQLLPDPHCLKDMEAAAERLAVAVGKGEKIAIFGDYDVDGAASCALLADYLSACGSPCLIHIPDRIFEGYGPNVEAIGNLARAGASLLITADCGTMSHGPLAQAQKLGLDVIVLDHHQAPEILPEGLIVNPNRQDDLSGLGYLCAAGVAFMLLVALDRILRRRNFFNGSRPRPELLAGLDLVALATIADVARLCGLNRAFVHKGLAVMRERRRPGLAALFDVAGAQGPPSPYQIGFLIGPRINAGGRIGDAALGARLLRLEDPAEAARIAQELDRLNRERRDLEQATLEEAEAMALEQLERQGDAAAIVVAHGAWHKGIVGLVASRLKDKFRRPVFAIALEADHAGTGSGRSILGVDLGRMVREAVEARVLAGGGGHAMAAGVTIHPERLDDFRDFLQERLAASVAASLAENILLIDAALTASAVTPGLVQSLERAGPFGAGNPDPVLVLPAHRLVDVADVGNGHVRLRARAGDGATVDGIAFRAGPEPLGRALHRAKGSMVHLAGILALDHWGGRNRVQLRLIDCAAVEGARHS